MSIICLLPTEYYNFLCSWGNWFYICMLKADCYLCLCVWYLSAAVDMLCYLSFGHVWAIGGCFKLDFSDWILNYSMFFSLCSLRVLWRRQRLHKHHFMLSEWIQEQGYSQKKSSNLCNFRLISLRSKVTENIFFFVILSLAQSSKWVNLCML